MSKLDAKWTEYAQAKAALTFHFMHTKEPLAKAEAIIRDAMGEFDPAHIEHHIAYLYSENSINAYKAYFKV